MLVENIIDETGIHTRDKVKIAIDRLQTFEPPEGYYLAFSGGKDSQTIYHLAKEAGVKFDAHYNLTTVNPPELVYFIRENYHDVIIDYPKESMWKLIIKNGGPPTRIQRFCCRSLKERGGEGRICVTGVRWAESVRRASTRGLAEFMGHKSKDKILFNDNDEMRLMMENCKLKGKYVLNPIIDWLESDVWDYLNGRNIKHCRLYDEGFKRLGCIGCPMSGTKGMVRDFLRWPKYFQSYIRTFEKVITKRKQSGRKCSWKNGEELMDWWIYGQEKQTEEMEGQESLFDE